MTAAPAFQIKVESYPRCALSTPRWWAGEVQADGGRVFVAGGNIPSATPPKFETGTTDVELLDLLRCRSERLGSLLQSDHRGSQPQILRNGQAVFFGGMDTAIVEIVSGKVVRSGGRLCIQRSAAASVELSDGRVLITGGYSNVGGKAIPQSSAEIYNPKTQTSTAIASMQLPRASHTLTPLGNGKYLLIGGAGNADQTAEIFDETTATFSSVPTSMLSGRKDHRAVLDNQGRIWLLGGTDRRNQSQEVIEYFDIRSQTFVSTSLELVEGREDLAALFIPELDVIVSVGGEKKTPGNPDRAVDHIEVLDLKTMSIHTGQLVNGSRDEPTLRILTVNPKNRTAEVIVLQGVAKDAAGRSRVPPPEKITIQLY